MLMHPTLVFLVFPSFLKCLLEYKMFEENLALLRTHHKNIQRYRQLLETSLTDLERKFIDKRLSDEQSAVETLSATMPTSLS